MKGSVPTDPVCPHCELSCGARACIPSQENVCCDMCPELVRTWTALECALYDVHVSLGRVRSRLKEGKVIHVQLWDAKKAIDIAIKLSTEG